MERMMTMIISPYQPPGLVFFGSVAVVFVVMLVLLPRYLSRTAARIGRWYGALFPRWQVYYGSIWFFT